MIKRLDWDSDFFEIEVGELLFNNKFSNATDFDLIYIKSNNQFEIEIENFKNCFFETKILFSKKIEFSDLQELSVFSLDSINYNIKDIYALAYESGKYSRFFLDKNFKENKFEKLYQKWVDNSVSKQFATDVLVYHENNKILGFVTYKINKFEATIGLIAVNPNEQGKGIGKKLLNYVENILFRQNINTLYIPTQKDNELACSFYKKQGYNMYETTIIKHFWK